MSLAQRADETIAFYREKKIGFVNFTVDAESQMGRARITNEEIADAAAANSDIMIAFGSIDPHKGKMGGREARRLVENHGVKGFKFHPTVQGFLPADKMAWPKYFAPQLVQYANTLLKDRILFGSDYPLITPDRWLADVEEAGFKNSVKPLILKENAMRLLGLK